MARDRQRAKQRKARREPTPPKRGDGDGIEPEARPLHRENVPGPVEHTGDVDEFEAALVAGADGQEDPDPAATEREALGDEDPLDDGEPSGPSDSGDGDDGGRDAAIVATGGTPAPRRSPTTPGENAGGRGGSRFLNFLRASWAELQRVQWPDRRQVGQATMVVLGFVLLAGAFLGFADFVANELVEFII